MRSLASLLELTMLLANVLFDRKSMCLRPLARRGISTSSLFVSCSRLIRATPFHTSKLPVTPPRLTALCATVEVPELMQSMYIGIHGYPHIPWDGVNGTQGMPGYCMHAAVPFPTWHRPYIALFEGSRHSN